MRQPFISVVIPTFNRYKELKVTLEKLTFQTVSPENFEVLVIDDGSVDGTREMVESMVPLVPYRLSYSHHNNRGPGFTQNRGIREANSNLVLLIADDIWATPELLAQHLETHTVYPEENVAVLGKVLQSPDLPPSLIHKYWEPFRVDYEKVEFTSEISCLCFFACNISVKKDFLMKNGLFRERKGAAMEDIELGYRLGQKGLRIIYNKRALVYHHHPTTLTDACLRAYEQGHNFDMLIDNIPKSVLIRFYGILSAKAGFKEFIKMLPRAFGRKLIFNKWTVNYFWLPILKSAEVNSIAAHFASRFAYEQVIGYHVSKGNKDIRKHEA